MFCNAFDRPMEFEHLALAVVAHVSFLSSRPIQWHMMLFVGALSQFPFTNALGANRFGDPANLFVRRSNHQHAARLSFCIQLTLSFRVCLLHDLGAVLPGNFVNSSHRFKCLEATLRITPQLLNCFPVAFATLPLYLGQRDAL